MVLKINQETFDDAVKENIEEFGMEPAEAQEEALKQFQAQGVDISHIRRDLMSNQPDFEKLKTTVTKLGELVKSKGSDDAVKEQLIDIKAECDKGIEYKVAAGKYGAYNILFDVVLAYKDLPVQMECLKTLISLMAKQPDLLDDNGLSILFDHLRDPSIPFELRRLFLRCMKECCVMHEMNRQKIFDAHVLDILKKLLVDSDSVELLRDILSLCRALVLDDDVRVEFGKAHEHARIIASEILCTLMNLLGRFKTDESLVHDVVLTISTLMVRTEFCKKVVDSGGLEIIGTVLDHFHRNEKIVRQCFKLLKALAGNDDCKRDIVQKHNLQKYILPVLEEHSGNVQTATAGLACVSALVLRSPENSKMLFEVAAPRIIINCMERHPDEKSVQKVASWAIRNMVSRCKYQSPTFLEAGVEPLLIKAMKNFKDIEYDLKAALRDLGCNVHLKEEWTGKGGALTTGLHKGHH